MTTVKIVALLLAFLAVPMFGQGRQRSRGGSRSTSPAGAVTPTSVLMRSEGTLRAVTKKEIRLEVEGDQTLEFKRTKKTKFLVDKKEVDPQKLAVGSPVVVEAERDITGELIAVNVIASPQSAPQTEAGRGPDRDKL